jgi:hypothetical protein
MWLHDFGLLPGDGRLRRELRYSYLKFYETFILQWKVTQHPCWRKKECLAPPASFSINRELASYHCVGTTYLVHPQPFCLPPQTQPTLRTACAPYIRWSPTQFLPHFTFHSSFSPTLNSTLHTLTPWDYISIAVFPGLRLSGKLLEFTENMAGVFPATVEVCIFQCKSI